MKQSNYLKQRSKPTHDQAQARDDVISTIYQGTNHSDSPPVQYTIIIKKMVRLILNFPKFKSL